MKLRVVVLGLVFLALFFPIDVLASATISGTTSGNDWSMPSWVGMSQNAGLIVWAENNWLDTHATSSRYNDGQTHLAGICYVYWATLNPTEGNYNWTSLDSCISTYISGSGVGVVFWIPNYKDNDGFGNKIVPAWVSAKPGFSYMSNGTVPAWNPGFPYETYLAAFLTQLGNRYKANPKLLAVQMRGLDKDFGEWYLNGGQAIFNEAEASFNLTPTNFQTWSYQFIDDWTTAFSGYESKLVWERSGDDIYGGVNYFGSAYGAAYETASRNITNYARSKGVGQNDGGYEAWTVRSLNEAEMYGQTLTADGFMETDDSYTMFSRLWTTENEVINNPTYLWPNTDNAKGLAWLAMNLRALQMRYRWIWVPYQWYDDYDAANPGFNQFLELSLGKTAATSADAWAWLRQGQAGGTTTIKNFERWLKHRDITPDGTTQVAEHLDVSTWGFYFNWFFENNLDYEARSTNVATGNSKVYFQTVRDFLSGGPHNIQIKVTYKDGPITTWDIVYKGEEGQSETPTITTANSGTWKTVTFDITDTYFDGYFTSGMDFYINNIGANDLTVQYVRIVKPSLNTLSPYIGTTSNSTPGSPYCGDTKPIGTVDLFQIDRKNKTATLYFTPLNSTVLGYNVIFGFKTGDERFGGIGMPTLNSNQGVQSLKIDHLDPHTNYSFKVIPSNGCALGDWSNWLDSKGSSDNPSIIRRFYRYLTNKK